MPSPFTITNPATNEPVATFDASGDLNLAGGATVGGPVSQDGRTILPGTLLGSSGLALQAAIGVSGYTLVNGTGIIISWTAPNDGNLHRAIIFGLVTVTSAETGGQIQVDYTSPSGGNSATTLDAGGHGVSTNPFAAVPVTIEAGSTVSVKQTTSLSAGAAVAWAEIWGL